ncbi:FAD-binding oxidoreductase [Natronomonas sp. F2-12]|jgi:D-lactate dehydrogenase (cytochrome)|uniref:D-lactate dehydrogenase (cytochrome) n=1 Tax=Natronomonas aquatica TaxID=2841590 RepID=A0A9R1D585_9EURY|nr:FAD-binding oxidoreductase [Natronomonas aquatica]MCQ4332098.1 FAD-binding oxidoreductase [Natronomonas aquatica]
MVTQDATPGTYDFLTDLLDDEQLALEESVREQFAADASPHEDHLPEVVVWPHTTAEVSAILEAAHEREIPVTPWSGGTGVEGNAIPTEGGIVLNTYEMESISVRPDDLQAVVGPGVVYDDLNEHLARYGLRFAPGISSGDAATIGGMIATNASGINAVGYGETRDHVLRLEVVLPDGRTIECGRDVIKTSAGYSLKDLFVGSEGTLGVVTGATLSLSGIPERKRAALVTFPTPQEASSAVSEIIRFGLEPGAMEFIDKQSVELVNDYRGEEVFPVEPLLIIELHGNNSGIDEDVEFVKEICEDNGANEWLSRSGEEMEDIWSARDDALSASRAYRENYQPAFIGDVVVPISKYPEIVEAVGRVADDVGVFTPMVGHAGDGNLHYLPIVDPDEEGAMERANEVNERVVETAIGMGGTATGEHGVGIGKRKFMSTEHAEAVDVMADIKEAIDPTGIMNPGKVLPDREG